MRDFRGFIRVLLFLLHPSAEGFSIHLRRYFQIARHNVFCGTGVSFCHFRKVNGQPPFPLLTMFPNLLKNQSVNGTSKCLTLFLLGIGVGNFRRFWSQRVLNDLLSRLKKRLTLLKKSISSIRKTCLNYSQLPCFSIEKPTLLN